MNIFTVLKEEEGRFLINEAATPRIIEPRAVPLKYSGIATVPQY
jgi:hypothetical protein